MSEETAAFAASACHPSFGEEAVSGSIVIQGRELRFESEPGICSLPLPRLQIELGAEKDGRIWLSDPEQPDWTLYTYDKRLLTDPSLLQVGHTRAQIKAIQSYYEVKRRIRITGIFLAACAVVVLVGSMLTGVMVRSLAAKVSPRWEQEVGDAALQELKEDLTFLEDSNLVAKLERQVGPLMQSLPRTVIPFKFHIVESPIPNAMALPGGHVLVNTGLLTFCDRPEQLAGVIAHEVAHVRCKHGFRQAISSAGPFLVFQVFLRNGGGLLGLLGDGTQVLLQQSFSQEYELEADAVGWDYLLAAHIDPRGYIEVLKKFKAEQAKWDKLGRAFQAFSSHPPTEKRIRRLEAKWQKLKVKSGFVALPSESFEAKP